MTLSIEIWVSGSKDDVVDGYEHQLNYVSDEANNDEAHRTGLQNFHVLYSSKSGTGWKLTILIGFSAFVEEVLAVVGELL